MISALKRVSLPVRSFTMASFQGDPTSPTSQKLHYEASEQRSPSKGKGSNHSTPYKSPAAHRHGHHHAILIPDIDTPDLERVCEVLREHASMLMVKREADEAGAEEGWLLYAREWDDWLLEGSRKIPKKAFWRSLNMRLGNSDFSFASALHMVEHSIGMSETHMQSIDMKSVEMYSGIVIRSVTSNRSWQRLCGALEKGTTLLGESPICGKLRHVCLEPRNNAVFVVRKTSGKIDFIGGKMTLLEYRDFMAQKRDHRVLIASHMREALEELNLQCADEALPELFEQAQGLLQSAPMRCVRPGVGVGEEELRLTLCFHQLAPFLLKIVISD